MIEKTGKQVKLWWMMLIVVIIWTITAGFWRDLSANNEEIYKGLKIFSDVLDIVENNYVEEVEKTELIEKAIQGMVQSLDPHSAFLPPRALEELQVDTQGEFGGIGIEITRVKGVLTVISPIIGSPAHDAGVKTGDQIIKVNGTITKDMMLYEAVKLMRGAKGTSVIITVIRQGEPEPLDFEIKRATIPIESVRWINMRPGFGYVSITNFRENTTKDLKKALTAIEAEGPPLNGLILDLRDNPGGLLTQAVDVTDLFIKKGVIVSMKGRSGKNSKVYRATPNRIKRKYPIVVLINGGSASASEIVAGALQDHQRALILGTTSFGKGSVQNVEALRDGYGLKLTIARYYTPKGNSIQAEGIEPDIVAEKHKTDTKKPKKHTRITEKDLKNHLEPEVGEPGDTGETAPDTKKLKRGMISRHGPLELETLKNDSQVMNALELLVGYHIFQDIKG
ncbi:MAG: S41 family peptidase [Deltaproteobacteria bacterium]|nr:S41 family peptidase [Deltaproteobacteria bacterium]